jgi:hypothetical protein
MKVKIQVVRWEITPAIPLDEFCRYIKDKASSGKDCKLENAKVFKAWPRFLFVNEHGSYWIILMLTIKAKKGSIRAAAGENGALQFIADNPDAETSKVAEFNYLMINKNTGVGVYSNHHGANRFDKFTSFFRDAYATLKREKIEAAVKAGDTPGAAQKKFRGRFGAAALLTKATASALVQELKSIDHVTLSFESLGAEGGSLSPYKDVARSSTHVIRFDPKTGISKIRAAIVETITSTPGAKGSVHGVHKDGLDKLIRLRTNLGVVDEFEHDEAIRAWSFDPEKLATSTVVKRMIKVVAVDPAKFVTKVRPSKQLTDDIAETSDEDDGDDADE